MQKMQIFNQSTILKQVNLTAFNNWQIASQVSLCVASCGMDH